MPEADKSCFFQFAAVIGMRYDDKGSGSSIATGAPKWQVAIMDWIIL